MHVGFHLVDAGRAALEARVGYRAPLRESLVRLVLRRPTALYLGSIAALTAGLLVALRFGLLGVAAPRPALHAALLVLALLGASEAAITVVNGVVTWLLPPRLLAKLAFTKGIPEEHRTLVVVPALLDGEPGIRRLLADLEVRSLANADDHLHFALVTDYRTTTRRPTRPTNPSSRWRSPGSPS